MGLSENEAAPLQKPANRPKERSRPLQSAYTRKVYFIGDQNFYIKGVTYGAFAPGEDGIEFHDFATIERDFARPLRTLIRSEFLTLYLRPRCLIRRIGIDCA